MTFTMMEKDLDMTKITVEEEVIIRIYDISYLCNCEHKKRLHISEVIIDILHTDCIKMPFPKS